MNYRIVDNFLSEEDFKAISDVLLDADFPWYTSNGGVGYVEDTSDKYFIHSLYINYRQNSANFNLIAPILEKINAKALIRAKANLYTRNSNLIRHGQHIDFEFEHKGFMFYLNTNDGFTELEDGTRIQSVANRGLFFEAHKPHNSTNCTDALCRVNISINYF